VKILITGGAGYIGSVTASMAVLQGHDVTVVDDLSTGHADAVPEGASFYRYDIASKEASSLIISGGFDAVLHFAARAIVSESVRRPFVYWRDNLGKSLKLFRDVEEGCVPRLIISSSCAVYGNHSREILEETTTNPVNPYGATKLAVDVALAQLVQSTGIVGVSLRYFNVAGSWAGLGERHDEETHLIPNILRAAMSGEPVIVYGNDFPTRDGYAVRDYVHVADVARAHLLALDAAMPGGHEVFNLGSGSGFSVNEIISFSEQVVGRPIRRVIAARREGDPAYLVADATRARRRLGWVPIVPIRGMIESALFEVCES
jgi:UDP-glucose 4-epimerase